MGKLLFIENQWLRAILSIGYGHYYRATSIDFDYLGSIFLLSKTEQNKKPQINKKKKNHYSHFPFVTTFHSFSQNIWFRWVDYTKESYLWGTRKQNSKICWGPRRKKKKGGSGATCSHLVNRRKKFAWNRSSAEKNSADTVRFLETLFEPLDEASPKAQSFLHIKKFFFNLNFLGRGGAHAHAMWDLSSLTRDWTCIPFTGSMESQPLDHQGIPLFLHILRTVFWLQSIWTGFPPLATGKIPDFFQLYFSTSSSFSE